MRILLDLTYVLIRTCDSPPGPQWVVWCPELDVMSQGDGPAEALWMGRDAVRLTVQTDINDGLHPLRRRRPDEELSQEPEWASYKAFKGRATSHWREWTHVGHGSDIPSDASVVLVESPLTVNTFGRECLLSEEDYGFNSFYYQTGGMVEVDVLLKTKFQLQTRVVGEVPTLESVRRVMGMEIHELLDFRKVQ